MAWLRPSRDGKNQAGAHMTFATSSVGRSISRTGMFLRKQIWIWPIIAVVLLSIIGLIVRRSIETTMRQGLESQLQTVLDLETAMLNTWYKVQQSNAQSAANGLDFRQTVYPLLEPENQSEGRKGPTVDALRAKLEKVVSPVQSAHGYAGYLVADKKKRIVAAANPELIGQENIPEYDAFLTRALNGQTNLSAPFSSVAAVKDETGRIRTGAPTMVVCAPIRDDSFQVVGALALRIKPEEEFSRIMGLGRFGETGETYAFDKEGRMVSDSRFDNELILQGLLPDQPGSRSILQLLVRDPGGNITTGFRPATRRRDLPMTHAVAEAVAGRSGVDVAGYRDYRGVPVVGAWQWLPAGDIGVATEVDYSEAFHPLTILRWTFWGLFALLALSAAAIFAFTLMLSHARHEAQKAAMSAQQVGQYKLEKKLGAGGMGVVYKGQHAMLRRPTAIKMLDVDKVNEGALARFEREVQITSQLNNPHTVAIYDYGRTPEGVFYYAMEYLDGIDLQMLVDRYGPQPVPRVIHILQQICSSLFEAHSLGLVHRDIKPANIMLNRRGGEPDVIKVLDFGLVKAVDDRRQAGLTHEASLTGTPLYMSPEGIEFPNSVDARSDIYAVGAVGYFLLTGLPVFEAGSVVELCQMHLEKPPVPPSERASMKIPPELENALLACLDKSRAKRPQTARDLASLIARCAEANQWSIEDSDAWWGRHERGLSSIIMAAPSAPQTGRTSTQGHDMTIDQPR